MMLTCELCIGNAKQRLTARVLSLAGFWVSKPCVSL